VLACLNKLHEADADILEAFVKTGNQQSAYSYCYSSASRVFADQLFATRSLLEAKSEHTVELLASQNLKVDIGSLHAMRRYDLYCASVTSMVSRLPPFDFAQFEGRPYLNIKSPNIVLAKYLKNAKSMERIAIVPTDEERIKIIIVPVSLVKTELEQSRSMQKVVRDVLGNIEIIELEEKVSMLIPSFNLDTVIELPELVGA